MRGATVSRRTMLSATVASAVFALAGCAGPGEEPDGATDDDPNENEGEDGEGAQDDDSDSESLHPPTPS